MDRPVRLRIAKYLMLLAASAALQGCSDQTPPPEPETAWRPFAEAAGCRPEDREAPGRYAPPRLLDAHDRVDRVIPAALEFDAPPLPPRPDAAPGTRTPPSDDRLYVEPLPNELLPNEALRNEPVAIEAVPHESYGQVQAPDGEWPIRPAPMAPTHAFENRQPSMPIVAEESFPAERPERLPPVDLSPSALDVGEPVFAGPAERDPARHLETYEPRRDYYGATTHDDRTEAPVESQSSRWTSREPVAVESPLLSPPDNRPDDWPEEHSLERTGPVVAPAGEAMIEAPVAEVPPPTVPEIQEPEIQEPVFEEPVFEEPVFEEPVFEEPVSDEAEMVPPIAAGSDHQEGLPLEQARPVPEMNEPLTGPLPAMPLREPAPPQVSVAVHNRALRTTQHGFMLAERGALYSARSDFIQALRLIAQATDAHEGEERHSKSLSAGLCALKEAGDFVPVGANLEADLDVRGFVQAHRTPVLKDVGDDELLTPLHAIKRYYSFAQEQLAIAGGGQPAASVALYGMGKVQMALGGGAEGRSLDGPKAMALHQAALLVDGNNYRAANELGVLLARYGQLNESKQALLHGLAVTGMPEMWSNLATVHDRLGEAGLARRARYEAELATSSQRTGVSAVHAAGQDTDMVQWVDPKTFAQGSASDDPIRPMRRNEGLQPTEKPAPQEKAAGGVARWTDWLRPTR